MENKAPKILGMKVYLIDNKPIFFGYDEEPEIYSLKDKANIPRPSYLDMFKSRELMPQDMGDVIMHNQLSPEDYAALQSKGIIPQELEILYQKIQDLRTEVEQLKTMVAPELAASQEQVLKSNEEQPAPEGTPSSEMLNTILEMIKVGIKHGVFDEIVKSSQGLSLQEKQILDLVAKHFNLTQNKE